MKKKIDRRESLYMVLDTETANGIFDEVTKKVSLDFSLPYDVSFVLANRHATIYREFCFVVAEIFYDKELMKSAYYATKRPFYEEMIDEGKAIVATMEEIRRFIRFICAEYNVKAVCAYNARFDYNATNNGIRLYTGSEIRYFLPYGLEIWDIMKMTNDTIAKQKNYRKFCFDNGYVTAHKSPRPQVKAETVYRYITNNKDFIESHTGLDDAIIEAQIMAHCFRQHKKMRKALFEKKD